MTCEIKKVGGKFIGTVSGHEIVRSTSLYYVKRKLADYGSITNADAASNAPVNNTPVSTKFNINERFNFVDKLVSMVATGITPSAIVSGEGGLGKTYTVIAALEKAGLKDVTTMDVGDVVRKGTSYRVIKGFSTAKGLYRTLAENAEGTIVFDDCDSVLKDPNALNILKGALDSFGKRVISWNTSRDDDDIPRWFEFKGSIIFISNIPLEKIEQSIRTRAMCVDLTMTNAQKIERMEVIAKAPNFLPDIALSHKMAALSLVDELKDSAKEVSLRTLIKASKIAASAGKDWKSLATYMLEQG